MSLEPLRPRRFGSETAVAAYWVSRCDGFRVFMGRREAGTVEHAVFDADPLDPVALLVRRARGRTQLIPLAELEAVQPLSRVLYFRKRPVVRAPAVPRYPVAAAQLRRGASGTLRTAIAVSRWTMLGLRRQLAASARAAARYWPSLRRLLLVAARVAIALLVFATKLALAVLVFAVRVLVALARQAVIRLRPLISARPRSAPAARLTVRSGR